MTYTGCVGIDAKTGNMLWRYTRKTPYKDVVIPTPLIIKDTVYTTMGMGFKNGCDLVKVTKDKDTFTAKVDWANDNLANIQGGVVFVKDHFFGFSESKETGGWVCQQPNGDVVWNDDQSLPVGSLIAVDGFLYCFDEETGTVALVDANNKGWTEKGRFTIPATAKKPVGARIWTHPVVANGHLYLRDQELFYCYKVK
jgi:outer membrane protein assembly factor BamB